MLEDSRLDAELVQELLESEHLPCEMTRVQTRAEFVAALRNPAFDLILADYMLPDFDGLTALSLACEARPELPFIFVSATLGEDVAVEALKTGATDYVVKSRLSRLVPSIRRALREASERNKRQVAERALRQGEMYFAEAQRLNHTGTFGWDPATGEMHWSDETYRIFGCGSDIGPSVETVLARTHPEDRDRLAEIIASAADNKELTARFRLAVPDGSIKFVCVVAHRAAGLNSSRSMVFVGAITDVTEQKHAEEATQRLRQLEADIAHVNRISMMGEMAASLAHEVNQPIAAAINDASACIRWLTRDRPKLDEAREAARHMIESAGRAADIIDRLRSFYKKGGPLRRELVDLNELGSKILVLLRDQANRRGIALRTHLVEVPKVAADRVQLQQVFMNLMLNAIEAMKETGGELVLRSRPIDDGDVQISVTDTGVGLPAGDADNIFTAFFTTKPQGTGMGLAICRSIIASHGGRLWATDNSGPGATFCFRLPSAEQIASADESVSGKISPP